ncbi:MAG: hypothetical protein AB1650_02740 [Candidatus Omnitrophota bacterium]
MNKFNVTVMILSGTFLITADAMAGGAAARRRPMPQPQQQPQQVMAQKLEAQKQLHDQILQKQDESGAPDEEMEFDQLWQELAVSSEIWTRLVDRQIKALIIETYIDWYREQGIMIRKSQIDYMIMIDSLALQQSGIFNQPFQNVLKFVAVMEYDFDNGTDKDQLARQILGPQLYEYNRQRFAR